MASTWASSVTSQVRPRASPPRPVIHAAHSRALSALTSTQTTFAPSSASPPAMPAPILGLVPVTIAILPWSFTRDSSADIAAHAQDIGDQRAGQRDQHDDAGDDHRLLELLLGD